MSPCNVSVVIWWLCFGRFADSVVLLATLCFSGSRVASPVEHPAAYGKQPRTVALFLEPTEALVAVEGTAATRLMAIVVGPSWVCFAIFNILWSAIRLDFASERQPRRTEEPARINSDPKIDPHARPDDGVSSLARRGWPWIACSRIVKEGVDRPRERGDPQCKYGAPLRRAVPRSWKNLELGGIDSAGETLGGQS